MLSDEMKTACAHLRVKAAPRENGAGTMSDWWECFDCHQRFVPVAPTEVGTIHGYNFDGSLVCEAESGEYAIRYADINCPDCLRDLDARPAAPEVPPAEPDNVIRDPSIGCCVDEGVCAHAERDVVQEMVYAWLAAIGSREDHVPFHEAMSAAREVAVRGLVPEPKSCPTCFSLMRANEATCDYCAQCSEIASLKEQLRQSVTLEVLQSLQHRVETGELSLVGFFDSIRARLTPKPAEPTMQEQLRQSVTQRDEQWEKAIEETRGTCVDWDGFMQGIRARLTPKPAEAKERVTIECEEHDKESEPFFAVYVDGKRQLNFSMKHHAEIYADGLRSRIELDAMKEDGK